MFLKSYLLFVLHAFSLGDGYDLFDILRPMKKILVNTVAGISVFSFSSAVTIAEIPTNDLARLSKGLREVDYLIDNWSEKTTYCNFGEVQRDMLDIKNKDKLILAAKKGGLLDYDKSDTMNVVCKKDPQVVRAFLGLTPDNLNLNKADILMRKSTTLETINPDQIDTYIEAVDTFSQAVAAVDGLSYNARSDYASTETFSKSSDLGTNIQSDYLEQCKSNVIKARDALRLIVDLLTTTSSTSE